MNSQRLPSFILLAALLSSCGAQSASSEGGASSTTPPPTGTAPPPTGDPTGPPQSPVQIPASAGPPIRMVAIGESWTSGQGDDTMPPGYVGVVAGRLAQARAGSTYENYGCAGWSAPQLLREGCDGQAVPVARVESARPTHVTVLIGANDIADWRWEDGNVDGDFSFDRYRDALQQVHARIAATGARLIQIEVPDLTRFPVARTWTESKKRTIRARIAQVNAAIRTMVAARRGIVVPLLSVEALYAPANFVGDGLHLNRRGATVVADALWSALSREVTQ